MTIGRGGPRFEPRLDPTRARLRTRRRPSVDAVAVSPSHSGRQRVLEPLQPLPVRVHPGQRHRLAGTVVPQLETQAGGKLTDVQRGARRPAVPNQGTLASYSAVIQARRRPRPSTSRQSCSSARRSRPGRPASRWRSHTGSGRVLRRSRPARRDPGRRPSTAPEDPRGPGPRPHPGATRAIPEVGPHAGLEPAHGLGVGHIHRVPVHAQARPDHRRQRRLVVLGVGQRRAAGAVHLAPQLHRRLARTHLHPAVTGRQ